MCQGQQAPKKLLYISFLTDETPVSNFTSDTWWVVFDTITAPSLSLCRQDSSSVGVCLPWEFPGPPVHHPLGCLFTAQPPQNEAVKPATPDNCEFSSMNKYVGKRSPVGLFHSKLSPISSPGYNSLPFSYPILLERMDDYLFQFHVEKSKYVVENTRYLEIYTYSVSHWYPPMRKIMPD